MRKLELKHLVPYQLHGLKVIDLYDNKLSILSGIGKTESNYKIEIYRKETILMTRFLSEIKPIFHPLTDLTKVIKINGEKCEPMIELSHLDNSWIKRDNPQQVIYYKYDESGVYESYLKTASPEDPRLLFIEEYDLFSQQHNIIEKLFEWNFDLFGLIPEGLAIDINTLK